MHKRSLSFLVVILLFAMQAGAQVKKYKAISNVAGSDVNGYVYVNLTGENKGMIKFEAEGTISDSNRLLKMLGIAGTKDPKFEINGGLVSWITIEKDTFYRFDAEDGREKMKNIFVKKLAGKGKVRLYSFTNKKNEMQYYVQLREDDPLKNINNVDIRSYIEMSVFDDCEAIDERFMGEQNQNKSPFANITTLEGKAAVWKALIEEYDACVKKK